jgi:hypothetical protein
VARIITTDGTTIPLVPTEGRGKKKHLGLEAMQQAVGGYIEIVYKAPGKPWGVCNEEGKLKGLPYNEKATQLWYEACGFVHADHLVGDIIVLDYPTECA